MSVKNKINSLNLLSPLIQRVMLAVMFATIIVFITKLTKVPFPSLLPHGNSEKGFSPILRCYGVHG